MPLYLPEAVMMRVSISRVSGASKSNLRVCDWCLLLNAKVPIFVVSPAAFLLLMVNRLTLALSSHAPISPQLPFHTTIWSSRRQGILNVNVPPLPW